MDLSFKLIQFTSARVFPAASRFRATVPAPKRHGAFMKPGNMTGSSLKLIERYPTLNCRPEKCDGKKWQVHEVRRTCPASTTPLHTINSMTEAQLLPKALGNLRFKCACSPKAELLTVAENWFSFILVIQFDISMECHR